MTHDEDDLRRALEARSGDPSPEFRNRLSQSLQVRPASRNLIPAIAFATVLVLSATSVGVLVAARHLGKTTGTAASGARAEVSPPLITDFTTVQLSAPVVQLHVWPPLLEVTV